MKLAIIGSGYVGLVTGVCLSAEGHDVRCVDIQSNRVETINRAEAPFYEPGLPELLKRTIAGGSFGATTDLEAAVAAAEIVMVAVGTPSGEGRIDLGAMEGALMQIGQALAENDDYKVVVIKSTVVPKTTDSFARPILEKASGKRAGVDFGLAMNPEFLREGSAIDDFANPDRIVIGALDERSGAMLEKLYASYDCPKVHTSLRNAELIKYTSNALLATLISFSNEIAGVCEAIDGTDVDVVMDGLHLDKRLSPIVGGQRVHPQILTYLRAGAGFGGSCLPKDVVALRHFGTTGGSPMPLLDAVLEVNHARAGRLASMLREELGGLKGRTVTLLGLAFKAGTDDLRESAALRIASLLLAEGADVRATDPVAMKYPHNSIDPRITVTDDPARALADADAVVLTTAWPEFHDWDWAQLTSAMRTQVVLDGRNALRGVAWPPSVRYRPIGTAHAAREVAHVG